MGMKKAMLETKLKNVKRLVKQYNRMSAKMSADIFLCRYSDTHKEQKEVMAEIQRLLGIDPKHTEDIIKYG